MHITQFTYSLLIIAFFASCGTSENSGKTESSDNALSEGIIMYEAKVLNNDHPLTSYAPTEAEVKIKNEKWHLEMSSMGFFHMYFIFNGSNNTLSQMAKCMDLKSACIDDTTESAKENANYTLDFQETRDTKIIAGYTCNRVIAKKTDNPTDTFSIYYTKDIGYENCNALTPYKKIKGMLMDYRMLRLGIEMRFEAKTIKKTDVLDSDFTIPEIFEVVPRDEFNTRLNSYLSGLSGI